MKKDEKKWKIGKILKIFYFILLCAAPYEESYIEDLDIEINSFKGFIKYLPNAIEKIIIGDNMASVEVEKIKAYQGAYNFGKSVN